MSNTPKVPVTAKVGNKTLTLERYQGKLKHSSKYAVYLRPIKFAIATPLDVMLHGGTVGRFKRYPDALECFNEALAEITAAFILGEE